MSKLIDINRNQQATELVKQVKHCKTSHNESVKHIAECMSNEQNELIDIELLKQIECAKAFSEMTGKKVILIGATIRHPRIPNFTTSICGYLDGEGAILISILTDETKNKFVAQHTVPLEYLNLCQKSMFIAGVQKCYMFIQLDGSDYRLYVVHRDQDLIEQLIKEA